MSALPSVTAILSAVGLAPDFGFVPAETLEYARARGSALHKAIALHHKGTLDESRLHPEIVPGFRAYVSFVETMHHTPMLSEFELVHPQWRYIGHPDRVGPCDGLLTLIDFKYTAGFDKYYVRAQLAGYRMAWNANHPEQPIERSLGIHLKKDGTFTPYDAPPDLSDSEAEQIFLAAVVVYRAMEQRGAV